MKSWQPHSWQTKPAQQQIDYAQHPHLKAVLEELAYVPSLVTHFEVEKLKQQLAKAALGEAFLLQGGDCAESFADCHAPMIMNKVKILLQMSLVLLHGLRKPVIRVGRIAGQYAKPRSQDTETQNGITLPSYRGDIINRAEFTAAARAYEPKRMLEAYHCSAMTLNYIRALANGGFADLHNPEQWNLDFATHSPRAQEFYRIAKTISDALNFLGAVPGSDAVFLSGVEFYTSHEALHLLYEQALTREVDGRWYNLATHFPWVGMRTADLQGAHIEYLRGIHNPVAVKISASVTPELITELVRVLNPNNEPGRLTFIHRFGAKHIKQHLPALIKAVQKTKSTVLWVCDPMHGNTTTTEQGLKTRDFDHILAELEEAVAIHKAEGSYLGGVHFEMTGENVTECVGGARGLSETDLERAYTSLCDPRLNYEQALEIAMRIVHQ